MGNQKIAGNFCAIPALVIGIWCASVRAAPLNLVQKFPDITTGFNTVTYAPGSGAQLGTGTFDASGFSIAYSDHGETPSPVSGANTAFTIHAILNSSTGALISGTIVADGKEPSFGASSGVLITGTLTNFGFPTSGGTIFEFLFHPTGGDLNIGPNGTAGVILDMHSGDPNAIPFTGSFASQFRNANPGDGVGNADLFPVPEPASIGMIGMCAASLLLKRRRAREDRTGAITV